HWPDGAHDDQLRYSLSDHLRSSTLELDGEAGVLTQERYYAFGGTACWAGKSALVANYKTIHYSGKERDATGLYYYGYRYYAPWLQRWVCSDPAGNVDGQNLFAMVGNAPLIHIDLAGAMRSSTSNDEAITAGQMHFKQHLFPTIIARKESDKERAIDNLMKVTGSQRAENVGELLEKIKTLLELAPPSFNFNPEDTYRFKGPSMMNAWASMLPQSGISNKNSAEYSMFDYRNSPVELMKISGGPERENFNSYLRPVYGALQIVDFSDSAGSANFYGRGAFIFKEQNKEYMTFTGQDSLQGKVLGGRFTFDHLSVVGNYYPVIYSLPSAMVNFLRNSSPGELNLRESIGDLTYVEWQSHSPMYWEGVEKIVFETDRDRDAANLQFLGISGIERLSLAMDRN
ncbi:RHS repeat domain-containing protein, partial [Pseudomonas sp. PD9R]|uniref:RHS repeat domain-containing protein n=1 Tax=Pseudomonas sp. PD9R TaxID=2853534 RepID=UPI0027377944